MKISLKYENEILTLSKQQDFDYSTLGYKVVEIDDKYEDCQQTDFDTEILEFNVDKYNERKTKELKLPKLNNLQNWFNASYPTYEQMLTRRAYLGIDDEIVDEFRQKTYKSLKDLYEEAEVVAKEIKELK